MEGDPTRSKRAQQAITAGKIVAPSVLLTTKIRIRARDARLVSVDGKGTRIRALPTLKREIWDQDPRETTVIRER